MDVLNDGLSGDDFKLQFTLLLRDVLTNKMIPREQLALICGTTLGTLTQWKLDNPRKWAGAERSKELIPKLQEIVRIYTESGAPVAATTTLAQKKKLKTI